jgi:hypothetical protein
VPAGRIVMRKSRPFALQPVGRHAAYGVADRHIEPVKCRAKGAGSNSRDAA